MTRVRHTIALVFLGLIVGFPFGMYLVQHEFIDKEKAIGMVSEEGFLDDYAKKEFTYADQHSAREALTYAVEIHRKMQGTSTLWGWPEKSDLAWCYAELALIEESAGNKNLASDYMSHAQLILKELGLKDPSEAHIRELLQRR